MAKICIKCIKELTLKKLVEMEGVVGKCSICDDEHNITIDPACNNFISLVNALIRFYYSEWE